MTTKFQPKAVWLALPVILSFGAAALQGYANSVPQMVAILSALLATAVFVWFAARLAWTPLIKKSGLWPSSILLISAIIGVVLIGVKIGGFGFAWMLTVKATICGLLFSWGFAAVRCAQD
jgi:hypothetical protein